MCGLNLVSGGTLSHVEKMNEKIAHRGRTSRMWATPYFAMGHVRLPIIGGLEFDQPYRKNGWTFLFVGEIVNFKELCPDAGSDVEAIADLWMDHGPHCVKLFDGFWSIVAIDDEEPREAHILVDFLAKKPLYVRKFDQLSIGVSSEIRALGPGLTADPVYFSSVRRFGYHVGSRTWAEGVRKLPPGSYTIVNSRDGSIRTDPEFDVVDPDPAIDLRRALETSIRRRVTSSDVPVSVLLSGGLDSSIIYQVGRRYNTSMNVYHVTNPGDDLEGQNVPSDRLTEIYSGDGDCEDLLKVILRANEGPVDLGSMIPQYYLGQSVKDDVCLSGDGADELFGGYRRSMGYDSQGSDIYDELVHYHLPRLDKMMMAGTVELRCPFLARDVLAGALALPYAERRDKRWLREAFRGVVPERSYEGRKVPLKSLPLLQDPIAWRHDLCDRFLKMIADGEVV